MEPVIEKFRTALVGFHRGDVLCYVEKLVSQHRSQVAELREELKRGQKRQKQLEQELEGMRQAHGSLSAEEARVRASLEASTRTLTQLRGELNQTENKLSAACAELGRLQGQVSEMEPMAQKYGQLKDYVATVELDAHHKAQETVRQAQLDAQQIQEETQMWLKQVLEGYAALRGEMDRLFYQLGELAEIKGQFEQADQVAQKLQQQGGEL